MGLLTTTIGAYPKPDYVNLPDWFDDLDTSEPTEGWAEAMEAMGKDAERKLTIFLYFYFPFKNTKFRIWILS